MTDIGSYAVNSIRDGLRQISHPILGLGIDLKVVKQWLNHEVISVGVDAQLEDSQVRYLTGTGKTWHSQNAKAVTLPGVFKQMQCETVFNCIYLKAEPVSTAELEQELEIERSELETILESIDSYLEVSNDAFKTTYSVREGITALNSGYPTHPAARLNRMVLGEMTAKKVLADNCFTTDVELGPAGRARLYDKAQSYGKKLPIERLLDRKQKESKAKGFYHSESTFGVVLCFSPKPEWSGAIPHAMTCLNSFLDPNYEIIPYRYALDSTAIGELCESELREVFNRMANYAKGCRKLDDLDEPRRMMRLSVLFAEI